jgi:hypothetical protein
MRLGVCLGSIMLWPKDLILLDPTRTTLGAEPSQPKVTRPMVPVFVMADHVEPMEQHCNNKRDLS